MNGYVEESSASNGPLPDQGLFIPNFNDFTLLQLSKEPMYIRSQSWFPIGKGWKIAFLNDPFTFFQEFSHFNKKSIVS